jgi:hypothetical protein
MNARYYAPITNRFISADTIIPNYKNPQEFNRYAYVTNNPINHTDPTGHCSDYIDCGDYTGPATPQETKDSIDLVVAFIPIAETANDYAVSAIGCGAGCFFTGVEDTAFDRGAAATGLFVPVGGKLLAKGTDLVAPGVKRIVNAFFKACNSFEAGTLVSTPDGLIPIEQLEIGDWVLTYNEETGEIGPYQITDTMFHLDPLIVYLLIDGELVVTTPEHPFYTSQSEWVNAGELTVGNEIRALDWAVGEVEHIYTAATPQLMYNLTVDTAHTFFVGEEQWLVHNAGPCDELALGFSRKLPGFKNVVPDAKNYMDLGLDPYSSTFGNDIFDAMNNSKAIHFDVSDMRYLNGPDGVLNGASHLNPTGSTNWELRTIWDNPDLLSKTTFYRNGEEISAAALKNLD